MKSFRILTDEDFDIKPKEFKNPRIRHGARGIVVDDNNHIAVIYKELKNEYKLPGGGINEFEDPVKAFKREVLEETGCKIDIDDGLGTFEEHKSQDNFKQISHIYVAHVISKGKPNYTEKELNEGARLLWYNFKDAMKLIKDSEKNLNPSPLDSNDEMSIYHTKFIVRRDYEILKYYKRHYVEH